MTRQALLFLGLPATEIQRRTETMRAEAMPPQQHRPSSYLQLNQLRMAERAFELSWTQLAGDSALVGQSIGASAVRERTGASIVGVMRDGDLLPSPEPSLELCPGDLVAVIGSEQAHAAFRELAAA